MTPGHFWCEYFEGDLVSVDYTFRKGEIYPQQAMKGIHHSRSLSAFNKWEKVEPFPEYDLPSWVDGLSSAKHINIDFKGGKIIETYPNVSSKRLNNSFGYFSFNILVLIKY